MHKRGMALSIAVLALVAGGAQPASAAAPPVPYTGSVYIFNNVTGGSAAGVLKRGNTYYAMTVGHVAGPLYAQNYVYNPGFYPLGGTAYNANAKYGGPAGADDIALIELGATRPDPRIRLCAKATCPAGGISIPQVAIVDSVPSGPDLAYGTTICHSGWSNDTQGNGGYRCGYADNAGDTGCTVWCGFSGTNVVASGDSGGPVWQPLPNGHIRLLGFMSNAGSPTYPYTHAYYRPVWHYTTHDWTRSQSCDYCPAGAGGTVVTGT